MIKLLLNSRKWVVASDTLQIYGRKSDARDIVLNWVVKRLDTKKVSVLQVNTPLDKDDPAGYADPNRILVIPNPTDYRVEQLEELKGKFAGIIFCSEDKIENVGTDKDVIINANMVDTTTAVAVMIQPDWDTCFVCDSGGGFEKKRNFNKGYYYSQVLEGSRR